VGDGNNFVGLNAGEVKCPKGHPLKRKNRRSEEEQKISRICAPKGAVEKGAKRLLFVSTSQLPNFPAS